MLFELCPLCRRKGKNSRLKSCNLNPNEFMWICENIKECCYPVGTKNFKVYKREEKGKPSSSWKQFKEVRPENVLSFLPSLGRSFSSTASSSSNQSMLNVSPTRINFIAADIGEDRPKLSWPNLDILKNVKIDTVSSNKEPLSKAVQEYFKKRNIRFESQINLPKINEKAKVNDPKGAEKNLPGQSCKEDDDIEIIKVVTAVPKVTENILKRKMDVVDSERAIKRRGEVRKLAPFTMEDIKKDIEKGRREAWRLKHKNTKTVNEKPEVIVIDDDDENDEGDTQKKVNSDCTEKCAAQKENSSVDKKIAGNQVLEKILAESGITQVKSSMDPKITGNQVLEKTLAESGITQVSTSMDKKTSGNQVLERSANSGVTQENLPTTIVNNEMPVASKEIPQEKKTG